MAQVFAYCYECKELSYATPTGNGVYNRDSLASNHWNHANHMFLDPDDYPQPIRWVLIKLGAGVEVTWNEIVLFKLAFDIAGLEPNQNQSAWHPEQPEPRRRMKRVWSGEYMYSKKWGKCKKLVWVDEETGQEPDKEAPPLKITLPPPAPELRQEALF